MISSILFGFSPCIKSSKDFLHILTFLYLFNFLNYFLEIALFLYFMHYSSSFECRLVIMCFQNILNFVENYFYRLIYKFNLKLFFDFRLTPLLN